MLEPKTVAETRDGTQIAERVSPVPRSFSMSQDGSVYDNYDSTVRVWQDSGMVDEHTRQASNCYRMKWTSEENGLFIRVVYNNQHRGEAWIRQKLTDAFHGRRPYRQCVNHLRLLREQGKVPPSPLKTIYDIPKRRRNA